MRPLIYTCIRSYSRASSDAGNYTNGRSRLLRIHLYIYNRSDRPVAPRSVRSRGKTCVQFEQPRSEAPRGGAPARKRLAQGSSAGESRARIRIQELGVEHSRRGNEQIRIKGERVAGTGVLTPASPAAFALTLSLFLSLTQSLSFSPLFVLNVPARVQPLAADDILIYGAAEPVRVARASVRVARGAPRATGLDVLGFVGSQGPALLRDGLHRWRH